MTILFHLTAIGPVECENTDGHCEAGGPHFTHFADAEAVHEFRRFEKIGGDPEHPSAPYRKHKQRALERIAKISFDPNHESLADRIERLFSSRVLSDRTSVRLEEHESKPAFIELGNAPVLGIAIHAMRETSPLRQLRFALARTERDESSAHIRDEHAGVILRIEGLPNRLEDTVFLNREAPASVGRLFEGGTLLLYTRDHLEAEIYTRLYEAAINGKLRVSHHREGDDYVVLYDHRDLDAKAREDEIFEEEAYRAAMAYVNDVEEQLHQLKLFFTLEPLIDSDLSDVRDARYRFRYAAAGRAEAIFDEVTTREGLFQIVDYFRKNNAEASHVHR